MWKGGKGREVKRDNVGEAVGRGEGGGGGRKDFLKKGGEKRGLMTIFFS